MREPRSDKTPVIKFLFDRRYDWGTKRFRPETVTQSEIQDAINIIQQEEGIALSVGNPANFLKDLLRSKHRNYHWPADIATEGYTGRQSYSDGRVFDFVPYQLGQTEPFPDEFRIPAEMITYAVETVSLPSVARSLGRKDEAWLIQVCVHQRVLQTHFALFSDIDVVDFFHLQNSIKTTPEIDALFLMTFNAGAKLKKALVTFEAKRDEFILPDQIRSQVARAARECLKTPSLRDIAYIIPVAAASRLIGKERGVAVFEMDAIEVTDGEAAYRTRTAHDLPLSIAKTVAYFFNPVIPGI